MLRNPVVAAAFLLLCAFFAAARPTAAESELQGVVVNVLPDQDEAVVRINSTAGTAATTMVFQIEPQGTARRLHPGDRITARADLTAVPAQLDGIRVVGGDTNAPAALQVTQPVGPPGVKLPGVGLFTLIMVILAGAIVLIYRWARIIFAEERTERR
jgi:hypothetical protein